VSHCLKHEPTSVKPMCPDGVTGALPATTSLLPVAGGSHPHSTGSGLTVRAAAIQHLSFELVVVEIDVEPVNQNTIALKH
jgi:hypothetical protein